MKFFTDGWVRRARKPDDDKTSSTLGHRLFFDLFLQDPEDSFRPRAPGSSGEIPEAWALDEVKHPLLAMEGEDGGLDESVRVDMRSRAEIGDRDFVAARCHTLLVGEERKADHSSLAEPDPVVWRGGGGGGEGAPATATLSAHVRSR